MLNKAESGRFFKILRTGNVGYKAMPKDLRKALRESVKKNIGLVRDRIRMSFRAKKHGRLYWIKGKRHRASAPGEPPAILTGALYRTIVPMMGPGGLEARIRPNVKYAFWLEEGTHKTTKKGTKSKSWLMRPRPYLKPAFDAQRKAFTDDVKLTVTRVLKQRAKKRRQK